MSPETHAFLFDNLFDRWDVGQAFVLGITSGLMMAVLIIAYTGKRST